MVSLMIDFHDRQDSALQEESRFLDNSARSVTWTIVLWVVRVPLENASPCSLDRGTSVFRDNGVGGRVALQIAHMHP